MAIKPVEDFGNDRAFWELLRSVNPHLPKGDYVTNDAITITAGADRMAVLTFSTMISLPDLDRIYAVLMEQDNETCMSCLGRIADSNKGDQ